MEGVLRHVVLFRRCGDKDKNLVHTTAENWRKWSMEDPSSSAYVFQGDPLYDDLCKLFALDNAPNDQDEIHVEPFAENMVEENPIADERPVPNNEVIMISDDDEVEVEVVVNANAQVNIVDISSDEEVVPILNFHDDEYELFEFETSDEEECRVDSPSLNIEELGEVIDDVKSRTYYQPSFRYEHIIPPWIALPNRGMITCYTSITVSTTTRFINSYS